MARSLRINGFLFLFLFFLVNMMVYADTALPNPFAPQFFYWPTRASVWGLGGDRGVGEGDVMLPLAGNDQTMFYADGQGTYASDQNGFGGAGVGLRQIYHDARIIGAYVFVDWNSFQNQGVGRSEFWFVSPGIESMGNLWDFRVNGYFPVSNERDNRGTTFADNVGNYSFVVFQGHQQFDHLFEIYNETGPGGDAEIGRAFPGLPNTRIYLGGYYFHPEDVNDIRGVSLRLNYPINHYFAIAAGDTYDNIFRNSFEAGIKITLGGLSYDVAKDTQAIDRRMVDPIPRNLATLSQGTAQPVVKTTIDEGRLVLERDHIYFFNSTGGTAFNAANGTANCTFENPCTGASFTQATVNSIAGFTPYTNFYFNPGTYSLGGVLTLNSSQSMFGRSEDYRRPALGAERALFTGGLSLANNTILDSIRVYQGPTAVATGITATNANNVVMNNIEVGDPTDATGYTTGMLLQGTTVAAINQSSVNALQAGSDTGIDIRNSAQVVVNQSFINAVSSGGRATAIITANNAQLVVNQSSINARAPANSATGVSANGTSQVTLNGDAISASGTSAIGVTAGPLGGAAPIVTIENSSINAVATTGNATGVVANNSAQVNISNSSISATSGGGIADAVAQLGASIVTVTNSQCFQNGVAVACLP